MSMSESEFCGGGFGDVPSTDPRRRGSDAGSGGPYESVPSKSANPDFGAGVPSNGYANNEGFDAKYDAQEAPSGKRAPKQGPVSRGGRVPTLD